MRRNNVKKKSLLWSIENLKNEYNRISFPEYQREPTVWLRRDKQRLIDSMVRQFDIASLYFYVVSEHIRDCIDGRQRIGAIMSFLGLNPEDQDNGFPFKLSNEVSLDTDHPFDECDGYTFEQLQRQAKEGDNTASRFVSTLESYQMSTVHLSDIDEDWEFNLQFTRLNLGAIINSGEKLHAMVGALRDVCFLGQDAIGRHAFLERTKIPTRRYAQEQVSAQILAQIFSIEKFREIRQPAGQIEKFTRTRHTDLESFFKQHATLEDEHAQWIQRTKSIMTLLDEAFDDLSILRSRALIVSVVLLAWELGVSERVKAESVTAFVKEFLCRLYWQVKKGIHIDLEYAYLLEFQRHVTQASVERAAVTARAQMLMREYDQWDKTGEITGDASYGERGDASNPEGECRESVQIG